MHEIRHDGTAPGLLLTAFLSADLTRLNNQIKPFLLPVLSGIASDRPYDVVGHAGPIDY